MTEAPNKSISSTDPKWLESALRGIRKIAASGKPFQAADVLEAGVPEPDNQNSWGGAFAAARAQGLIKEHGFAKSKRPESKGALVRLWIGIDGKSGWSEIIKGTRSKGEK